MQANEGEASVSPQVVNDRVTSAVAYAKETTQTGRAQWAEVWQTVDPQTGGTVVHVVMPDTEAFFKAHFGDRVKERLHRFPA